MTGDDGTDRTDGGDGDPSGDADAETAEGEFDEDALVDAAAEAARDVVFSRYDVGEIDDFDVTVVFEDGRLSVDVYVLAPDGRADERRVADDAAMAARAAVDERVS